MLLRTCTLALFLATGGACWGHGALQEQIDFLSQELQAHPNDPDRLLHRAELHGLHEDWPAAAADIASAVRAGAPPAAAALARARLATAQGHWDEAAVEVPLFTAELTENSAAWRVAATILVARRDHPAAVSALRSVIAKAQPPLPDDFLQLAGELALSGEKAAAIDALDAGLKKLGAVPSLLEAAARYELELGRVEAALARYDRAAAGAPNPAFWLARKAEAAGQAGLVELAAQTRATALAAFETLPEFRRRTTAMADLEKRLRGSLPKPEPSPAPK